MIGAINWHSVLFLLFSLFACGFALGVLFAHNVVRMAFYLIISLAATAGLFILAGAEFVGAMQIMIYVGGTLVLLIFGVMLTAQATFVSMKTRAGEWIIGAIVGGTLLALLVQAAFSVSDWRTVRADQADLPIAESKAASPLGLGILGVRVDKTWDVPEQMQSGMAGYLLPFEIVSVHLLVVLVGAAYLCAFQTKGLGNRVSEGNMNPLTNPVSVSHFLIVGAVMFVTGIVCMATKRNALGVLMGIELVLNGANINFVAFGSSFLRSQSLGLDGQFIALFVIVLAAAEAAVALAIALNFYNNHGTIDVDRADELRG